MLSITAIPGLILLIAANHLLARTLPPTCRKTGRAPRLGHGDLCVFADLENRYEIQETLNKLGYYRLLWKTDNKEIVRTSPASMHASPKKNVALTEAAVAIDRKRRMIGHLVVETETA